MSLTPGKRRSLADKLRAQEVDAQSDKPSNVIMKALKKATVRAKKEA